MDFQELVYHLEAHACHVDLLIDQGYFASNCINGQVCIIEDLPEYSVPTLCHYFYELGIPAPSKLAADYERYRGLREEWAETLKVPRSNESAVEEEGRNDNPPQV